MFAHGLLIDHLHKSHNLQLDSFLSDKAILCLKEIAALSDASEFIAIPESTGWRCRLCVGRPYFCGSIDTATSHLRRKHRELGTSTALMTHLDSVSVRVVKKHPFIVLPVARADRSGGDLADAVGTSAYNAVYVRHIPTSASYSSKELGLGKVGFLHRVCLRLTSPFIEEYLTRDLEGPALPDFKQKPRMNSLLSSMVNVPLHVVNYGENLMSSWWSYAMGDNTLAYRRSWLTSGSRGDVMKRTRSSYSITLSRLLNFMMAAGVLRIDKEKDTELNVPALTEDLFQILANPLDDVQHFGHSIVGQFVFLSYLNTTDADRVTQCLSAEALRKTLAALKYIFLCVCTYSFLQQRRDLLDVDHPAAIHAPEASKLIGIPVPSVTAKAISDLLVSFNTVFHSDGYVYAHICRLSSDCVRAVATEPPVPRMRFVDQDRTQVQMEGRTLSFHRLRDLAKGLLLQARKSLSIAMRGHSIESFVSAVTAALKDGSLTDSSFDSGGIIQLFRVPKTSTPLPVKHQFDLFRKHWDCCDMIDPYGDPATWPNGALAASAVAEQQKWLVWLQEVQSLQRTLFVLVLICGGSPKRVAELSQARIQSTGPSAWEQRTVSVAYGTLSFCDAYSKTSTVSSSGIVSRHFLPRELASIIFIYLTCIRALEASAAARLTPQHAVDERAGSDLTYLAYAGFMWTWKGKRSSPSNLANSVVRAFRSHIHEDIGVARYRQMVTCLAEVAELVTSRTTQSLIRAGLTQGSGHAESTRSKIYGRVYADSSIAELHAAASASSLWHIQLGHEPLLPKTAAVGQQIASPELKTVSLLLVFLLIQC